MAKRYVHVFEQSDGSVLKILCNHAAPTVQLLDAMSIQGCDWITTVVNPNL